MGHLASMTEAGDGRGASYVAGRLVATLEVIAKISGELGDLARSTTFNITNNVASVAFLQSPGFARVQATIMRALTQHPAARADVVAALRGLDAEGARTASAAPAIGHGRIIEMEPAHVAG
jgi:hypothetical protein